jgi:IS30 family transposase
MPALSIRACAEDLGVAPSTIWRLVQRGILTASKPCRVYRVEQKDWADFKARIQYAPPLQAPSATTPVNRNLIDACKPTH